VSSRPAKNRSTLFPGGGVVAHGERDRRELGAPACDARAPGARRTTARYQLVEQGSPILGQLALEVDAGPIQQGDVVR